MRSLMVLFLSLTCLSNGRIRLSRLFPSLVFAGAGLKKPERATGVLLPCRSRRNNDRTPIGGHHDCPVIQSV